MISEILTMGEGSAAQLEPTRHDALLSIVTRGRYGPDFARWEIGRIHGVAFDDDQLAPGEPGRMGDGLRESEARGIVEQVLRWHADFAVHRLIVHCTVGVSRSVSVAAALRSILHLPGEPAYILNPKAHNAVIEAWQRRSGGRILLPSTR